MALIPKCTECPDRVFDSLGSARGHGSRVGHVIVEIDEALDGDTLEDVADEVAPDVPAETPDKFPVLTGELREQLDGLADTIRANYATGRQALRTEWDSYRAIAEALAKARELLRGDNEYGRWVKEQEFPFQPAWANILLRIGKNIDAAQEFVDTSLEEKGEVPGIRKIVREVSPPVPKRLPAQEDPDEEMEEDEADDVDDGDPTRVLRAFLFSDELNSLMDVPVDDRWAEVPEEERGSASAEFKRICEKLIAINAFWKENPHAEGVE